VRASSPVPVLLSNPKGCTPHLLKYFLSSELSTLLALAFLLLIPCQAHLLSIRLLFFKLCKASPEPLPPAPPVFDQNIFLKVLIVNLLQFMRVL
jgi:hypothetical protein